MYIEHRKESCCEKGGDVRVISGIENGGDGNAVLYLIAPSGRVQTWPFGFRSDELAQAIQQNQLGK